MIERAIHALNHAVQSTQLQQTGRVEAGVIIGIVALAVVVYGLRQEDD